MSMILLVLLITKKLKEEEHFPRNLSELQKGYKNQIICVLMKYGMGHLLGDGLVALELHKLLSVFEPT